MGTKRPLFLNSPGSDLSNSLHLSGEDRMFLHSNKFHGVKIAQMTFTNDIPIEICFPTKAILQAVGI